MTDTKMKLNLNGIEIELPNNAKVDVSQDGKCVKVELSDQNPEVVERIKVVEVEKYVPCSLQHYPSFSSPHITWATGYGSLSGTGNIQDANCRTGSSNN